MKTAIVTGASRGIGRAVAEGFLREGYRVGLIARSAAGLADLAQHDNAIALPADVSDAASIEGAFSDFMTEAGRLDVLFNNAGMSGPTAPVDEIPVRDFDQVIDINVKGMFYAARLAFGAMRRQSPMGGRIINNGSVAAHVPRPGMIAYTASKHAVTGLTRSLSLDGRPFDIACGQIDIGNARTELMEGILEASLAADPDADVPPLMDLDAVTQSVLHMARLPLEANVQFMTVMATKMPYIGRG